MNNIPVSDKKITAQIVLYLIDKLGTNVEGKKKLMKLMFLLEHYDLTQNKIVQSHFLGNGFQIYYYGVFSPNVMDVIRDLITDKTIIDGFPLVLSKGTTPSLDEKTKNLVDGIIEKFGNRTGYYLEVETLKMLGIEPYRKKEFFGKSISSIIKASNV